MEPIIAEIIGTFLLMLLGCGVNANVVLEGTKGQGSGWIVITTGCLASAGEFPWSDVPAYVGAQMIGAFIAAVMVWLIHKDHFEATPEPERKLGVFSTSPAIKNTPINLLGEIAGTFVLVFAVLYFKDATLQDTDQIIGLGSLGALPVAIVVWGIGLSLGGTTGYAINPARDLGPRIAHAILPIRNKGGSDWGYSWVPILGPIVGAVAAAVLNLVLA